MGKRDNPGCAKKKRLAECLHPKQVGVGAMSKSEWTPVIVDGRHFRHRHPAAAWLSISFSLKTCQEQPFPPFPQKPRHKIPIYTQKPYTHFGNCLATRTSWLRARWLVLCVGVCVWCVAPANFNSFFQVSVQQTAIQPAKPATHNPAQFIYMVRRVGGFCVYGTPSDQTSRLPLNLLFAYPKRRKGFIAWLDWV